MKNDSNQWHLELFIVRSSSDAEKSIAEVESVIDAYCPDNSKLTIIDLSEFPERASDDNILAIPTLIRRTPLPPTRVIGQLSDASKVWSAIKV